MILLKVIKNLKLEKIKGNVEKNIDGIYYDSRKVEANGVFVCIPGFKVDGHAFASEVVKKGAAALIVEKDVENVPPDVTLIYVKDAREALAEIAAVFYDHPSRKLKLVGVTGTKGKTTTSYMLRSIFEKNGEKVGLLGTINYEFNGEVIQSKNTTPESLDLEELFLKMVVKKVETCIMEVSSHSLKLKRVHGLEFDTAVFTNFTQDHLDFHKTFEDYLEAKLMLFKGLGVNSVKSFPKVAVVNLDDPKAADFMKATKVKAVTYGLNAGAHVDVTAKNIVSSALELSFDIVYAGKVLPVKLQMRGRHNISNALAAAAAGFAMNIHPDNIQAGLENLKGVPGRFEVYNTTEGVSVLIDYAHSPDSLEKLLLSAKDLKPSRIITVFGCGGDRDRSKRPIMGKIAMANSDITVITSDNPRTEDALSIIKEIKTGMNGGDYKEIPDRKEAIRTALLLAKKDDVVVIAGKGHEDYQIIGKEKIHFSDKETAESILSEKGLWKKY
ncbi:MAG: UDP-N-acetylmuramoyl-L-alanyl-D-glutamate--2,6-diaminopimelate ligase [Candidatus Firestonebacteria bacterium RIFOXYC2_FULL_39_67]|nr:MAG: UDP-N-acetylmuramoyl-L-alanyl-D-glutamate--2,6-diaminopimelate ligase [Candidatus Firestonebacteria bacterium RIFOXYD2_FULL_39_29]OGF54059.1 MAG: UDP-N-acetylmuramoyl-L-alanyl-D-glutamate--2,6-diaminopimelate ligase [Candidatus Firestonebacteria bacterium RifOxyC12_full_39_7]OGF56117.1 MAG: UDP-N-acetylmuramoyl-L-alanyl-D-glutamate--2,6-diaminopimelate ligase [Candidatus Firestonebacteria bacterium RIFOXYC2_FULL_39_67]